eukprot:00996.XXX_1122_1325_1 [CDS] Oithona nana genome sequencing.
MFPQWFLLNMFLGPFLSAYTSARSSHTQYTFELSLIHLGFVANQLIFAFTGTSGIIFREQLLLSKGL